jgi:hypothetical protein
MNGMQGACRLDRRCPRVVTNALDQIGRWVGATRARGAQHDVSTETLYPNKKLIIRAHNYHIRYENAAYDGAISEDSRSS